MQELALADEVFLIGHDENSGKPLISDAALDTAIAGAVLGELVFADRISITEETLVVAQGGALSGDPVCDATLDQILKQRAHHPVRAWTEHLRETVRPTVAARLEEVGLIERVESRALLKTAIRYPAKDTMATAAPEARIRFMLEQPATLDERTAVLAGILVAANLEFVLGGASSKQNRTALIGMASVLRAPLRSLLAGVESSIAALAMRAPR